LGWPADLVGADCRQGMGLIRHPPASE